VDEVEIGGQSGHFLRLRRTSPQDSETIWSYEATLSWPAGTATTEVVEHGGWLAPFFRELADAWSGFDGAKEYGSLEGQLHLSCTHDGLGTVACVVTLEPPWL
jgi:hypothetical protein